MIVVSKLISRTFLRQAEWHEELTSTNDLALERSAEPALELPLLIGATSQSLGRGRGTNTWWAASGTLTFSVILDMPGLGLPQSQWPQFSLGTALGVADALSRSLPDAPVGVKWPNDVWLDGRKICGILIEQSPRNPSRVIAGIGLNVNTDFSSAPEELRSLAMSMAEYAGRQFPLEDVLIDVLQCWEAAIQGQQRATGDLPGTWSQRCVLQGRIVRVTSTAGAIQGECLGVNPDGALVLSLNGKRVPCYAGTVRIVTD